MSSIQISQVYLVTNADKYKHYERWATARGFPRENVINDGTTSNTGGLGALADLDLALRSRKICTDDVLVGANHHNHTMCIRCYIVLMRTLSLNRS